jgi:hypothetical protein
MILIQDSLKPLYHLIYVITGVIYGYYPKLPVSFNK